MQYFFLTLPYLTSGVGRQPQVDGYKAVVGCEAETSTRALVTCSNLPTRVWSAVSQLLTSRF